MCEAREVTLYTKLCLNRLCFDHPTRPAFQQNLDHMHLSVPHHHPIPYYQPFAEIYQRVLSKRINSPPPNIHTFDKRSITWYLIEYDVRHTIHLYAYALGLSESQIRSINMFVRTTTMTLTWEQINSKPQSLSSWGEDWRSSLVVFFFNFHRRLIIWNEINSAFPNNLRIYIYIYVNILKTLPYRYF